MGRIRTIKPEFPQSESMGNVSRDARLTFILLWTLVDDSGRTRGNSRMLASLLYPYDEDATNCIEGWLSELEGQKCIHRYVVDGNHYLEVCNWSKHQKIDRASQPKYPANPEKQGTYDDAAEDSTNPRESSTNTREPSMSPREKSPRIKDQGRDQGSRKKDQGEGEDQGGLSKDRGKETSTLTLSKQFDYLKDPRFEELWNDWLEKMRSQKLELDQSTQKAQLRLLSKESLPRAREVLLYSLSKITKSLIFDPPEAKEDLYQVDESKTDRFLAGSKAL